MRMDVRMDRADAALLLALLEEVQLAWWEARDDVARLEEADGEGLVKAHRKAARLEGQLDVLRRLEDVVLRRWPGLEPADWWEPGSGDSMDSTGAHGACPSDGRMVS